MKVGENIDGPDYLEVETYLGIDRTQADNEFWRGKATPIGGHDLEATMKRAVEELVYERVPVHIFHPKQIKIAVEIGIMTVAEADYLLPDWRER